MGRDLVWRGGVSAASDAEAARGCVREADEKSGRGWEQGVMRGYRGGVKSVRMDWKAKG